MAHAAAQEPYVFLEGSTHSTHVTYHENNSYEWAVYKVTEWSDQKDGTLADNDKNGDNDDFLFVGDNSTSNNISITWLNPGRYYLIVQEFNGLPGNCSTRRAFPVEIKPNLLQIAMQETQSEDCADGNNELLIPLKITSDGTNPLPEDNYSVTLTYSVLLNGSGTEEKIFTKEFLFVDVGVDGEINLSVKGIVEEITASRTYTITIKSAIDGFKTPFIINPAGGAFTRTIHQLPQPGELVQY